MITECQRFSFLTLWLSNSGRTVRVQVVLYSNRHQSSVLGVYDCQQHYETCWRVGGVFWFAWMLCARLRRETASCYDCPRCGHDSEIGWRSSGFTWANDEILVQKSEMNNRHPGTDMEAICGTCVSVNDNLANSSLIFGGFHETLRLWADMSYDYPSAVRRRIMGWYIYPGCTLVANLTENSNVALLVYHNHSWRRLYGECIHRTLHAGTDLLVCCLGTAVIWDAREKGVSYSNSVLHGADAVAL